MDNFALKILLFCFYPNLLLVVVLLGGSDSFSLIFLFYFVHVALELKFELLVFLLFSILLNSLILFLFLLLSFEDLFASDVNGIVAYLSYESTRVGVYEGSILHWADLLFLKLLFSPLNFPFFLLLKLLHSIVEVVGFSDWTYSLVRRYLHQSFLQFHCQLFIIEATLAILTWRLVARIRELLLTGYFSQVVKIQLFILVFGFKIRYFLASMVQRSSMNLFMLMCLIFSLNLLFIFIICIPFIIVFVQLFKKEIFHLMEIVQIWIGCNFCLLVLDFSFFCALGI